MDGKVQKSGVERRRDRLRNVLTGLFLFALVMGPGPGLYLVSPDAEGPAPTVLGVPVLYAWTVFWFFVMAAVVLIAYRTVWAEEEA